MSLHPTDLLRHAVPDRRRILGASEVAAVFERHPWTTAYALWASKTQPEPEARVETAAMRAGHEFEATIYGIVGARLGLRIIAGDAYTTRALCVQADPTHPLGSHPDAWVLDDGQWCPVEVKTISHHRHEWPDDGVVEGLPLHYELQVWAQLACCPAEVTHGWLAAALNFDDVRIYRIARDPALEAEMLAQIRTWWDLHVVSMSEPAVDGSDRCAEWMRARWPRQVSGVREAVEGEADLIADWREARGALADAEAIEAVTKARLLRAIAEAEGITCALGVATWRAQSAMRIDVERLRAEFPDAARACEKVSESRVLRFKGAK